MALGLGMTGNLRGVVASAEAIDRVDPDVDQEAYVRFLEEARLAARLQLGRRWAVSLVAADRVGLVADVAEVLRAAKMNIEAASHATIGGSSALSVIASTSELIGEDELAEALCQVEGVSEPRTTVDRLSDPSGPAPTADHTLWHLHVEAMDRQGVFHRLTSALAERGAWLVRFGTSRITNDGTVHCLIDINAALPPGIDLAELKAGAAAALTDDDVLQLKIEPISAPVEGLLTRRTDPLAASPMMFLSVMGKAQPGLVAAVAEDLDSAGFSIVGSTMAILEGRTLAIFALSGAETNLAKVEELVARSAEQFDLHVAAFTPTGPGGESTIGEIRRFYCLTQERQGVLSRAARALANAEVNIECMAARVIGNNTSACVINMFVRCSPETAQTARALLQELADGDRWIDWSFDLSSDWAFTATY